MRKNLLLIPILIYLMHIVLPITAKSTEMQIFNKKRNAKLISFNTNSGKIEMALDLSLPFLSIPLGGKNDSDGIFIPSIDVNSKTLALFSVLTVLSTVVPWLVKQKQLAQSTKFHHYSKEHKRRNRELESFFFEDRLNKVLIENSHVASCIQSTICKAVASEIHLHNSSRIEEIIDRISSNKLLDKVGISIRKAIWKGRRVLEPDECIEVFKGCSSIPNQQITTDILKLIGIG